MIGTDSRYATCVLYVDGSVEFLGTRPSIDTSPRPDDTFHTVVEGDRVDLIAYRYLGSAGLWWVICDYNDISFPPEIEPGRLIRMPSVECIEMKILT